MASFLSITDQQSINTVRTAAPLYMKQYSDLTKRSHMLFSMMESWGNIEYGATDASRVWQVMVRQPTVSNQGPGQLEAGIMIWISTLLRVGHHPVKLRLLPIKFA